MTSQSILFGIQHVTNMITFPRNYESRSRDSISGYVIGDRINCHVTSVIPYMAQKVTGPGSACHSSIRLFINIKAWGPQVKKKLQLINFNWAAILDIGL